MSLPTFFFFIATTLLSTCNAQSDFEIENPIRQQKPPQVGRDPSKINCQSFRLGVEANNIQNWEAPPDYCLTYIESYMTGKQYILDVEAMVNEALNFARSTPLPRANRPNAWVFDLDDTLLRNIAFFNFSKDGGEVDNELTNAEFKAKAVRSLVFERSYRIIATVGDQWCSTIYYLREIMKCRIRSMKYRTCS